MVASLGCEGRGALDKGRVADVGFKVPSPAAATVQGIGPRPDRHVPDLPGQASASAQQFILRYDAATYSCAPVDIHEVTGGIVAARAKPYLAQRGQAGIVVEEHRHVEK